MSWIANYTTNPIILPGHSPYVFSLPSTYSTVESDPEVRLRIINLFHSLLREWLADDWSGLLGSVRLSNGESDTAGARINHICSQILSKSRLVKIFDKISKKGHLRWIDLPNNKKIVRDILHRYLVKKLKHT